jgi:hypothetical protein
MGDTAGLLFGACVAQEPDRQTAIMMPHRNAQMMPHNAIQD